MMELSLHFTSSHVSVDQCRWWWWRWWWSIGVVQQLSQTRLWPPTTIMMGIVSADRVNHSRNKIMLNKNPPGLVIHHHSPGTVHEMNDNNEKNMLWLLLQPTYYMCMYGCPFNLLNKKRATTDQAKLSSISSANWPPPIVSIGGILCRVRKETYTDVMIVSSSSSPVIISDKAQNVDLKVIN